jgi:ATP-binding cassette, subfamily D (ALD), peroxisomal long-chain fatty acid import protein
MTWEYNQKKKSEKLENELVPARHMPKATTVAVGSVALLYGALFAALRVKKARAAKQRRRQQRQHETQHQEDPRGKPARKKKRGTARRVMSLLPVLFPGRFGMCRESAILVVHTILLVLRTYASVLFALLEGDIVASLGRKDARRFTRGVLGLVLFGVPVGGLNAAIKYCQDLLTLGFRSRLTRHAVAKYMEQGGFVAGKDGRRNAMTHSVFYAAENLDFRVRNADQLLVSDIERFSAHLAELWSSLAKPSLDLIFFNWQLARNIGLAGFLFCTALVHLGTTSLNLAAPRFGSLVAETQRLEGLYRAACARVITYGEEIAFYGGARAEQTIIERAYSRLEHHLAKFHQVTLPFSTLEHFVTKYYWSAVGFLFTAVPVFGGTGASAAREAAAGADGVIAGASAATSAFVTNRRLLVSISDAFGRFLQSIQQLSQLGGHAQRIDDMFFAFSEIRAGRFVRSTDDGQDVPVPPGRGQLLREADLDHVSIEDVELMTPTGDSLVKHLTFVVKPGEHVFVTGPNGCGKSSLFRVLAGLWPVCDGTIRIPVDSSTFYIPQRPYLVPGTLRDNIIYPHTHAEMEASGVSDDDLRDMLRVVDLEKTVDREADGFDAQPQTPWEDILSGGEKQRLAMARVLYHKPTFAVLDECTSAVSEQIEDAIYEAFKERGATLFTISHRRTLWKHHSHLLSMDGRGGYEFRPMTQEDLVPR